MTKFNNTLISYLWEACASIKNKRERLKEEYKLRLEELDEEFEEATKMFQEKSGERFRIEDSRFINNLPEESVKATGEVSAKAPKKTVTNKNKTGIVMENVASYRNDMKMTAKIRYALQQNGGSMGRDEILKYLKEIDKSLSSANQDDQAKIDQKFSYTYYQMIKNNILVKETGYGGGVRLAPNVNEAKKKGVSKKNK